MKNLSVFITTSNSLMHCCPTWAYLFNKFWPYKQKVYFLGYKSPSFELPSNFEYISMGEQRGPKYWSNDISKAISKYGDDLLYLTFEDSFLIKPVDKEILDLSIEMGLNVKDDTFSKFCLTADVQRRPHEVVEIRDGYKVIKATQSSEYRQSLSHGIWRKDVFLSKLKLNQSPWDFELDNETAMNDGMSVYSTLNKYAVHWGHAYVQGRKLNNWYENAYHDIARGHYHDYEKYARLDKEHVDYVEGRGWL
mgnify:CR=1 FL=1